MLVIERLASFIESLFEYAWLSLERMASFMASLVENAWFSGVAL